MNIGLLLLGWFRHHSTIFPSSCLGIFCLLAFRDKIYCLCLGFAGNAADARDLAQDTFAKALVHCADARPDRLQPWIMRIACNTCLDQARRRKTRGPLEPVSESAAVEWRTPEDHAGSQEEIRIVRQAIASLPRRAPWRPA